MTSMELRLKAAAIIEERGWHQGSAMGRHSCCLVEALNVASDHYEGWIPDDVISALQEMGFKEAVFAVDFNDQPERTVGEVLERLRSPGDARQSNKRAVAEPA